MVAYLITIVISSRHRRRGIHLETPVEVRLVGMEVHHKAEGSGHGTRGKEGSGGGANSEIHVPWLAVSTRLQEGYHRKLTNNRRQPVGKSSTSWYSIKDSAKNSAV